MRQGDAYPRVFPSGKVVTMPPIRGFLALLVSTALAGCPSAVPPCPSGSQEDEPRQAQLRAALAEDPRGAALLAEAPPHRLCFATREEEAGISGRVLRVPAAARDEAATARFGHLLLHLVEGDPWPPAAGRSCAERLALALEREARGHALEDRLLKRAGLSARPPSALATVLAGYRRRCEEGG
ncbi:MAG: hypothetical protein R3B72_03925 [Polyangiaceae bacterium]